MFCEYGKVIPATFDIIFRAPLQQTYEIMPTELRAQGVSLSRCLSQFARIFSSYVVFSVREIIHKFTI